MRLLLWSLSGCWVLSDVDVSRHDDALATGTPSPTPTAATADTGPPPTPDGDTGAPPTVRSEACSPVHFTRLGTWSVGRAAEAVVAGDLDGDGDTDLAVPDRSTHSLHVTLGDGRGAFTPLPPLVLHPDACPDALAIGAFDGGGRGADLAVVDRCTDAVWVTRVEEGALVSAFRLDGPNARALASAPFDGDAVADLVVVRSDGLLDPHLRTLDGFEPGPEVHAGHSLLHVAAGRLDGDDAVDLAVLDGERPLRVRTLVGDGTGGFEAREVLVPDDEPTSVAIHDLDGDGIDDVIAAGGTDLEVFLSGGRSVPRVTPLGNDAGPAVFADFRNEGCWSALVLGQGTAPELQFRRGLGDGSFDAPRTTPLDDPPDHVAVGQFDDPASPLDLAVVVEATDEVLLFLGGVP